MDYSNELEFAKQLASGAGKIMRRYFRSDDIGTTVKGDRTLVTLADTDINTMVIKEIKKTFPSHSVQGEEEVHYQANAPFTWVCDPVDGTQPFAKGIPVSTFSLALVNDQGRAVLGVVYDPFQNRLFEAVRNQGAMMNGVPIRVSDKQTLDGAFIEQELWINEQEGVSFDDPKDIFNKAGAKVTNYCSAVMLGCLVGEGTFDAMIFGQSKPEDIAALSVIVEESGGRVTTLNGKDQRYDKKIYGAVVSNGYIHDQIIEVLSTINYVSKNVPTP